MIRSIGVLSVVLACSPAAADDTCGTWIELASSQDNFAICTPAATTRLAADTTERTWVGTTDDGRVGFMVGVTLGDHDLEGDHARQLFDGANQRELARNQTVATSRVDFKVGTHPGRDLVYVTEVFPGVPGKVTVHHRMTAVGKRVYHVTVNRGSGSTWTDREVARYLGSFRLLAEVQGIDPGLVPVPWQAWTAVDSRGTPLPYSVLVPGKLVDDRPKLTLQRRAIGLTELAMFKVPHRWSVYATTYTAGVDPAKAFDIALAEIGQKQGFVEKTRKALVVGRARGLELAGEMTSPPDSDVGWQARIRLYLIGGELFGVYAFGPPAELALPEVQKFLDSFKPGRAGPARHRRGRR